MITWHWSHDHLLWNSFIQSFWQRKALKYTFKRNCAVRNLELRKNHTLWPQIQTTWRSIFRLQREKLCLGWKNIDRKIYRPWRIKSRWALRLYDLSYFCAFIALCRGGSCRLQRLFRVLCSPRRTLCRCPICYSMDLQVSSQKMV